LLRIEEIEKIEKEKLFFFFHFNELVDVKDNWILRNYKGKDSRNMLKL